MKYIHEQNEKYEETQSTASMFEQSLFSKFELRNEHFNKPYTASALCLILILIHTTPLHVGDLRHLLPTDRERERDHWHCRWKALITTLQQTHFPDTHTHTLSDTHSRNLKSHRAREGGNGSEGVGMMMREGERLQATRIILLSLIKTS